MKPALLCSSSAQVSHHPPVTAFYITNRKEGFCISGSILAKSKFYGNSVCAVMDGVGKLTFLGRGEDYLITMPYANCKGKIPILISFLLYNSVIALCVNLCLFVSLTLKVICVFKI